RTVEQALTRCPLHVIAEVTQRHHGVFHQRELSFVTRQTLHPQRRLWMTGTLFWDGSFSHLSTPGERAGELCPAPSSPPSAPDPEPSPCASPGVPVTGV